jgi:hypothetical protein
MGALCSWRKQKMAYQQMQTKQAPQAQKTGKDPDYSARTVAGEEGKERWTGIGVAFVHGENIHVLMDAVPVNGKVILFPYVKRPQA